MPEPRKLPRPHASLKTRNMVDIGRNTQFGNPYFAAEPLAGTTIPHFREYLWKRMNNEPEFRKALMMLVEKTPSLWCPGCGPRGKNCVGGVCHGGTIIDALEFLVNNPSRAFADRGRLQPHELLNPTQPKVGAFVHNFLR